MLTRKKLTGALDTLNEVGIAAQTKAEIDELGAHLPLCQDSWLIVELPGQEKRPPE
ncbi:hypothetical protein [Marinobacter sediminicola]|uniref:hypothetical protein n=1 Tax=Marinobacter sediminicola TaxID=3072994 RepID=UPI0028110052|nr:hypothetical protein [Marinobacter sp. F26243]